MARPWYGVTWAAFIGRVRALSSFHREPNKPCYPSKFNYAESKDGILWVRKDGQAGIDVSRDGWDSEMICFPTIIEFKGIKYMFYNGNKHGIDGFGIAVSK